MNKIIKTIAVLLMAIVIAGCGAMNKNLHIPAGEGDLEKVKMQTEGDGGMPVDKPDAAGQTALMYAAQTGRIEVIEYLLSKGADINAQSGVFGLGTPLIYAASGNRLEAIELLIDRGADIDATTSRKSTALMIAAAQGHVEAVKLLLEKGANPNLKNKEDQTVLDVARSQNQEAVVQLLEDF